MLFQAQYSATRTQDFFFFFKVVQGSTYSASAQVLSPVERDGGLQKIKQITKIIRAAARKVRRLPEDAQARQGKVVRLLDAGNVGKDDGRALRTQLRDGNS